MKNKEIEELLSTQTVGNYKKAAKLILKNSLVEYCDPIIDYLKKLLETKKSYETICLLIDTIGLLKCKSGEDLVKKIYDEDIKDDIITMAATKAYVRIIQKDDNDVNEIMKALESKGDSAKEAVLEVLGYDKIVPTIEEQKKIIELSWDFGIDRIEGYSDPRYGLAAACAGWTANNVDDFLRHCMLSDDEPLKYVASSSLKKKYVKLR